MARLSNLTISGFILTSLLVPAAGFAAAGEHFCKRTCPPYCHPTFGFTPTTWRVWPTASCAEVRPVLPVEPHPATPSDKDKETVPAPKPEDSKGKEATSEQMSSIGISNSVRA